MYSINEANRTLDRLVLIKDLPKPTKITKKLILYGAGNMGKLAKQFLDDIGFDVDFILDKNPSMASGFFKELKVNTPESILDIKKADYLVAVSIVNSSFKEIKNYLEKLGFYNIVPFYDIAESYHLLHPLRNGWFLDRLNLEEIENIRKVISMFSDDNSKAYYLQFLYWRLLRVEKVFNDTKIDITNRFFIPEITDILNDKEIYLDCGSHHGEVIERFINIVNNKFKKIYAIEPDKNNIIILDKKIQDFNIDKNNFKLFTFPIGDSNEQKTFAIGYGYASKLTELETINSERFEVKRIDDLNIKPTFIKFHLEGGEYNALKGSIDTIVKNRPILCITTYHNKDGVWKIPLFLKENLKNYKFIFRLHSWCGIGAVLYAIPDERIKDGR